MKIYQENIKKYNSKTLKLKKLFNRISLLRLLIFVIAIAIIITLFSFNLINSCFHCFTYFNNKFCFCIKAS